MIESRPMDLFLATLLLSFSICYEVSQIGRSSPSRDRAVLLARCQSMKSVAFCFVLFCFSYGFFFFFLRLSCRSGSACCPCVFPNSIGPLHFLHRHRTLHKHAVSVVLSSGIALA